MNVETEIKDYVVLSRGEDNSLPPRPLILDVTMTHDRYGRITLYTNGKVTHAIPPMTFLSLTMF